MSIPIEEQLAVLQARTVDFFSPEELKRKLEAAQREGRSLRIKYGADPSAPDIHLGHVVGLNKLRAFQDCGHTVVFIIGDFTGMIGDPSGRSNTRKPLSREQVQANALSYQEQVFRILDRDKTEVRFNSEWLSPLGFEDVIRLSAHVTVAQMLARDDFSKRYAANQPISLVEFLYPLVQAYDSVVIRADVEIGGTDQLFNLLLGRELQKLMGQEPQIVLTLPLLEGLDGVNKMSKSLGNYIGVAEPAKEIFGKAMSISDDLMWRYFSLVLNRSDKEIQEWREQVADGKLHPRDVKDRLGRELVARFFDAETGEAASQEFRRVFSAGQIPEDIAIFPIPGDFKDEEGRVGVVALLVASGLCASNGEARRLLQQGGVRIQDNKVTDPQYRFIPDDGMIVRAGKRGFVKLAL
ncbi:MAG TPA: tyrosine--tRNA ligase [Kiritimatiellia bacterium]|nr:tyrosine--tRNA ligase [Kiritimatiellia bacterium]HMO98589.1 tyrosine--tRNA ligase [Kiritimatiellia bacterium]HMP95432.1 tyrosine--tRNA ligase [Kiritimatiellia bacterium]